MVSAVVLGLVPSVLRRPPGPGCPVFLCDALATCPGIPTSHPMTAGQPPPPVTLKQEKMGGWMLEPGRLSGGRMSAAKR